MSPMSSVGFSSIQGLQTASRAMQRHAQNIAATALKVTEGGPLASGASVEASYTGMLTGLAAYKAQLAPLRASREAFDALSSLFGPTSRVA